MSSMEPRQCLSCSQRLDGAYVRCSACKAAFYCTVDCQRQHWDVHQNECSTQKRPIKESTSNVPLVSDAPTHNLGDIEIQQEKETAMMEEFYKWRKIWYSTIVKCVISMLSCEPYGLDKLKSHGLAIWVSERAEYGNLDASKEEIKDRAERYKWQWDVDWWEEGTAFKIEYIRLVPWEHLVAMLECFPMENTFLNSLRTLCPPNKLRIIAFLSPSFLSYDNLDRTVRGVPPPRWSFPATSQISAPVRDLITRSMPFFEPLVTSYRTSGTTDPEDKTRYAHFDADAWEWIIKKVVEFGWYSNDGRIWREFIEKMSCKQCRGSIPIPSEMKTGLAYMTKVDNATGVSHSC